MENLVQLPWLLAVIGFVVLGAGIAYGVAVTRRRTPVERELTAAGTRRVYREEERAKSDDD
ncbi:MAG TPA: hypothetical protein VL418_02660 [Devosiaceae bacterium]|jgi:hypothetical protein|nr:hypothetical protein [Devosiaceae bacterium]